MYAPPFYMGNTLDCYFSESAIINYLSRQRAKLAKKRSKDHIMAGISKNDTYHNKIKNQGNILFKIMPPRRLWVKLPKERRCHNGYMLNSMEKNKKAICSTVIKHKKASVKYKYLDELEKFIKDIHKSVNSRLFTFKSPKIRPEPKKKGGSICRPISSFLLKDNLINCLTNKYLVNYFDDLFYENSFAFRAARLVNDKKVVPNHHDAFSMIIDYLKNHIGERIYIAECDMQKFYDTVNHKVVIRQFRELCSRKTEECDKKAKRIFYRYLQCYNFYKNVYSLDQKHFDKYRIKNGEYKWIDKKELRRYYKLDICLKQVGIPQGGALSGLIANIVLDYADNEVLKQKDDNLLYIRYCDDMIMMHTNKEKCEEALRVYENSLCHLKLFPHPVKNIEYGREFWEGKSRGPYEWSDNGVPCGLYPVRYTLLSNVT